MSPYDRIAVTAACIEIPRPLVEQLVIGGKLISPVQEDDIQELLVLEKSSEGVKRQLICEVLYVPLRGVYGS